MRMRARLDIRTKFCPNIQPREHVHLTYGPGRYACSVPSVRAKCMLADNYSMGDARPGFFELRFDRDEPASSAVQVPHAQRDDRML